MVCVCDKAEGDSRGNILRQQSQPLQLTAACVQNALVSVPCYASGAAGSVCAFSYGTERLLSWQLCSELNGDSTHSLPQSSSSTVCCASRPPGHERPCCCCCLAYFADVAPTVTAAEQHSFHYIIHARQCSWTVGKRVVPAALDDRV